MALFVVPGQTMRLGPNGTAMVPDPGTSAVASDQFTTFTSLQGDSLKRLAALFFIFVFMTFLESTGYFDGLPVGLSLLVTLYLVISPSGLQTAIDKIGKG